MLREHKASTKMIRAAARSNLQSPSDVVDLSKDDPVSISDTAEADLKRQSCTDWHCYNLYLCARYDYDLEELLIFSS